MDFTNVINSFKIILSMEADTSPLIGELVKYCHGMVATVLPNEDHLAELIERGKARSMYAMKEPDQLDLPSDFIDKNLYILQNKRDEYVDLYVLLQNIHIIDNEYVVCVYQVCYQYEDDDPYGYSPSGKAYFTGYSHWLVYVNGMLINKESVDKGNDYRPWYVVKLDNRVEWKQVVA